MLCLVRYTGTFMPSIYSYLLLQASHCRVGPSLSHTVQHVLTITIHIADSHLFYMTKIICVQQNIFSIYRILYVVYVWPNIFQNYTDVYLIYTDLSIRPSQTVFNYRNLDKVNILQHLQPHVLLLIAELILKISDSTDFFEIYSSTVSARLFIFFIYRLTIKNTLVTYVGFLSDFCWNRTIFKALVVFGKIFVYVSAQFILGDKCFVLKAENTIFTNAALSKLD